MLAKSRLISQTSPRTLKDPRRILRILRSPRNTRGFPQTSPGSAGRRKAERMFGDDQSRGSDLSIDRDRNVMIAGVPRRDVVGRPVFDRVYETEWRDLSATWKRGRRDPRQTQTDGAALGTRCRDAVRRDVGRPVRPRRPLARANPPRIFRSKAERSGATRRDAPRRMLREQSCGRRDDAEEAAKDARNSCSSILKFEGARIWRILRREDARISRTNFKFLVADSLERYV